MHFRALGALWVAGIQARYRRHRARSLRQKGMANSASGRRTQTPWAEGAELSLLYASNRTCTSALYGTGYWRIPGCVRTADQPPQRRGSAHNSNARGRERYPMAAMVYATLPPCSGGTGPGKAEELSLTKTRVPLHG